MRMGLMEGPKTQTGVLHGLWNQQTSLNRRRLRKYSSPLTATGRISWPAEFLSAPFSTKWGVMTGWLGAYLIWLCSCIRNYYFKRIFTGSWFQPAWLINYHSASTSSVAIHILSRSEVTRSYSTVFMVPERLKTVRRKTEPFNSWSCWAYSRL